MSFFSQFTHALPIICSLVVIEGLLSVDNALAIAVLASPLPPERRKWALRLGVIGAYLFRGLALLVASWIIANPWVKVVGALYLVYLMCANLTSSEEGESPEGSTDQFWPIFWSIQIVDLSLSFDNVVAAVALSPKFWVVCTGVFIGILVFRFLVNYCVGLLKRFPILASAAFLLVGYVGILLLLEVGLGITVGSLVKFGGILLILAAALGYEKSPRAQRRLKPIFDVILPVMNGVRRIGVGLACPFRLFSRRD